MKLTKSQMILIVIAIAVISSIGTIMLLEYGKTPTGYGTTGGNVSVTITENLEINLSVNSTVFNSLNPAGGQYVTVNTDPLRNATNYGMRVENIGNRDAHVWINSSINASTFWGNPSTALGSVQVKAMENITGFTSCVGTLNNTYGDNLSNYTCPGPGTGCIDLCTQLDTGAANKLSIHYQLIVPQDAAQGVRSALISVVATQAP